MTITVEGGVTNVTMDADELLIIRYALDVGAEKLAADARFLKSMKSEEHDNARVTADRALAARDALEAANQAAARS